MNSEDASISPLLAVFVGCLSAFLFALFIIICKQYFQQIKKKDTLFGFVITAKKQKKQRLDSTYDNCEYCGCCKDHQIPCQCGCNSNNNSNSLSQNDPDIDSNVLIYDREKLNESLLDALSEEKRALDLSKINFCQNSLDVASLDEIVNEELLDELDKNVNFKLDENDNQNDNQSYEILKPAELSESTKDQRKPVKQLSLSNDKPIKVILKLHKNLPVKLHSQSIHTSIELINERPFLAKSRRLVSPLLRRASLAGLVRQKSFDLGEEEVVCQENSRRDFDKERSREFILSSINNQNHSQTTSPNKVDCENRKNNLNHKSVEERIELSSVSTMNDRLVNEEQNRVISAQDNRRELLRQTHSLSDEPSSCYKMENKEVDYNKPEYKDIWTLRTALEAEVDKDLNDSFGDLSEILNNTNSLMKQSSIDSGDHELVRSIALSSSDQRLSKNDSGYKSIERRDFSIDLKSESLYNQFTGSSLSKDFSLGSISNQNISLSSGNSISLDVKNYKNQYSIKEEPEDSSEQKITFV